MNRTNQSVIGGVIALLFATSCCWLPAIIIGLGGASSMLAFANGLEEYSGIFMVIAMGFLSFGGYQYYKKRNLTIAQSNEVKLQSVITCPECGHSTEETMPTDACQFFYECESCKVLLKPNKGDCCVYCSFGSVPCPPIQKGDDCCS